jgi:hypothetical protein
MLIPLSKADIPALLDVVRQSISADDLRGYDDASTAKLRRVISSKDAIDSILAGLLAAISVRFDAVTQLELAQPLVEATVRAMQHPDASALSPLAIRPGGESMTVVLQRLSSPNLGWDVAVVAQLLITDLQRNSAEHCIDDQLPPWKNYWGTARGTAYCLFDLVALRAVGRI